MSAPVVQDTVCSWKSCGKPAYSSWSRRPYCYSCFNEILADKNDWD